MGRFVGILGIIFLLGVAWLMSTNRRAIRLKTVLWGLGLQFGFAVFVLHTAAGRNAFKIAGDFFTHLLSYSYAGSEFVFGELGKQNSSFGVIFAFQIMPIIIFIAAFFSVLYYLGVMQVIIRIMAWVMVRVMGTSGAESLNVAASIFMGQTEAPLTIRPFIPSLTRSELMTVMTAGMAHVSGSVMGAYILFGARAEHLLSAVIMTAPGTILMAKMLVPETETPITGGRQVPGAQAASAEAVLKDGNNDDDTKGNLLEAIAKGTTDGLHLALNVGAMLIAFVALIALVNGMFGAAHNFFANHGAPWFPSSLGQVFGVIFAPIAWLIGVPWKDCLAVGNLLGTRMSINEFFAYIQLGKLAGQIDPRSFTIATFALCGFANFSSIGIQIGGISALAPSRRRDLAKLGLRAMIAGTMANLMSASIVGILLSQ